MPTIKEQFVFSTPDGALHFYSVDNNQITATQMHVDVGIGVVSSLAWKDNFLVSGGTSGAIQCYNIDKKKLQCVIFLSTTRQPHLTFVLYFSVFETHKGLVKRIRFSPSPTSHQVLVLFNDGDFGIWDLDYNVRVAHSSYFKMRDLRANDVDWVSESQPIIATTGTPFHTQLHPLHAPSKNPSLPLSSVQFSSVQFSSVLFCSVLFCSVLFCSVLFCPSGYSLFFVSSADGCVRIVDKTFSQGVNSPIQISAISYPLYCPLLLPPTQALYLKAMLLHPELSQSSTVGKAKKPEELITGLVAEQTMKQLIVLKPGTSTAERCLLVAKYFGNTFEIRFWTLAIDALKKKQSQMNTTPPLLEVPASPTTDATESSTSFNPSTVPKLRKKSQPDITVPGAAKKDGEDTITITGAEEEDDDSLHLSSLIPREGSSSSLASSSNITGPGASTVLSEDSSVSNTVGDASGGDQLPACFDLLLDSKQIITQYSQRLGLHEQKRGTNHQLARKLVDFSTFREQKAILHDWFVLTASL